MPGASAVIANIGFIWPKSGDSTFDPTDAKLDLLVVNSKGREIATHLPLTAATIRDRGNSSSVRLDGQFIVKTPVQIDVVPRALKIIVGSDRIFN